MSARANPKPTPASTPALQRPPTTGARHRLTMPVRKKVLAVVHNVIYLQRLLEVLSLLEADFRIQVVFTVPPHTFGAEVPSLLARLGSAFLPWESARRTTFDLALAAGPQGVEDLQAPLVALSHGGAYLKRITGLGPAEDGIPGLRRRDVMPDGATLPAALVLPHADEMRTLERSCPEALPVARVVGDPMYDRIAASLRYRADYRRALGLGDGQKLVLSVSTWGPNSSFGKIETLLPRLSAELPADRFRAALLVHPNVWAGHGTWQMRSWLAQCVRRGIWVVPPEADWRSMLIAGDFIIGDHGSVTLYGTMTGAPILLAASPEQEINPDSPGAALATTALALSPTHPLHVQLEYAAAEYREARYAAIAARISSEPGRFNRRMRSLLYELLGLGQPAYEPVTAPLPLPTLNRRTAGGADGAPTEIWGEESA